MRNTTVELADGEYELAKREAAARGHPTAVNIRMIERRMGLRPGQLYSYRANHYSRRNNGKKERRDRERG